MLVAAGFASDLVACNAQEAVSHRAEIGKESVIEVPVGATIAVLMTVQLGTGYDWHVEGTLPDGVALLGQDIAAVEKSSGPMTTAETRRYTFKAQAAGNYRIRFVSRRAWEQPQPSDNRIEIVVTVDG